MAAIWFLAQYVNKLRQRQNGRRFAGDVFICVFLKENLGISLKISLRFVPEVWINKITGLVQIMAWRRLGDKPLSGPMMVCLPTYICVTRLQYVNGWPILSKLEILLNDSTCKLVDCNSLWPGHPIWWYKSWSTLVQVITCHLNVSKQIPEQMLT